MLLKKLKKVASKENTIRARLLPDNFLEGSREEAVKLYQYSRCDGSVEIIEEESQADLVIENLAVRGIIEGAVAIDCDFVVVAGSSMMLINDFKIGKPPAKKEPKSVNLI